MTRHNDAEHHFVPPACKSEVLDRPGMRAPLNNGKPARAVEGVDGRGVANTTAAVTAAGFRSGEVARTRRLASLREPRCAALERSA
ncbi:MAG: hypothetical protein IT514_11955 [Burkholderiales bacterium]|nr:hypothetical protein [Burkholderiales bacterium]